MLNIQIRDPMTKLFKNIKISTLILLGAGVFGSIALSGCASADSSDRGKIGPDYDDPQMKQLRMQEAQSRVTRSLIR